MSFGFLSVSGSFWSIIIVSGGFVVYGLKLTMDPNPEGEYYDKKLRKAKDDIWRDDLRYLIGELICEVDDQSNLLDHLKERDQFDQLEEEVEERGIDLPKPDYSDRIGEDVQYLPSTIDIIDEIKEIAQLRSHLINCNEMLPHHRERIGWALLIGAIGLMGISLNHFHIQLINPKYSIWLGIANLAIMISYGGYHYRELRQKRETLMDNAPVEGEAE